MYLFTKSSAVSMFFHCMKKKSTTLQNPFLLTGTGRSVDVSTYIRYKEEVSAISFHIAPSTLDFCFYKSSKLKKNVGESGLKRDNKGLKVFLASKKLYNITENPLEETLDISKPEYIFILRIRTIFRCIKRDFLNPCYFPFYLHS